MIKVSFIVPIYNSELYLRKCIDSILEQTISKEIILIDDGSKDNSLSIALDYANKYSFITVIHQANRGLSATRNRGIDIAKGEYIQFVDSDDYLLDNIISNVYNYAKPNNADIAQYQVYTYFQDGNREVCSNAHKELGKKHAIYQSSISYFNYLVNHLGWCPLVWAKLYKREFLIKNNLRFLSGVNAEDQLFVIQSYTCDKNAIYLEIEDFGYAYVRRDDSIDKSYNIKYYQDHLIICNHIKNWMENNEFDQETISSMKYIINFLMDTAEKKIYPKLSINDQAYIDNLKEAFKAEVIKELS